MGRPLLADVGDENGDDAGDHDSLKKSPDDELRERGCRGGEQRGDGHAEDGGDNDSLAGEPLRERSEEGRGESDGNGGGRDGEAGGGLGDVED